MENQAFLPVMIFFFLLLQSLQSFTSRLFFLFVTRCPSAQLCDSSLCSISDSSPFMNLTFPSRPVRLPTRGCQNNDTATDGSGGGLQAPTPGKQNVFSLTACSLLLQGRWGKGVKNKKPATLFLTSVMHVRALVLPLWAMMRTV